MSADRRLVGTTRQIEAALDVLLRLSEECDDGELRDHIGVVRSALWDLLDDTA